MADAAPPATLGDAMRVLTSCGLALGSSNFAGAVFLILARLTLRAGSDGKPLWKAENRPKDYAVLGFAASALPALPCSCRTSGLDPW